MTDFTERPLLVTRKEAAAEMGVTPYWVDQLIANGDLAVMRLGRAVRIHRNSLDALKRRHASAESA